MSEEKSNEQKDRLKIWDYAFKTDPETTKKVSYGARSFTTVDAYSQIHKATKMWGSMGSKWGVMDEKFEVLGTKTVLYTALLFYKSADDKSCFIPIHSDDQLVKDTKSQKNKYNDDWSKKLATDALTKGLSKLGFNADIFTGQFEQKYHN